MSAVYRLIKRTFGLNLLFRIGMMLSFCTSHVLLSMVQIMAAHVTLQRSKAYQAARLCAPVEERVGL